MERKAVASFGKRKLSIKHDIKAKFGILSGNENPEIEYVSYL